MTEIQSNPNPANPDLPGSCSSCPSSDRCREVWSITSRGLYTPAGLVIASILVFLLPLFSAIAAGAIVPRFFPSGDSGSWMEIFAAAGGGGIGAFLAWFLMPLLKKRFHE